MNRDILYPFAGSFSIHLAVFLILLALTGTGEKIIGNKVSFTEVSFVGHDDMKMAAIMQNIAEIKKQSPDMILFSGTMDSKAGENPVESFLPEQAFKKRGTNTAVKAEKNILNKKTAHLSLPSHINKRNSGDIFIENKNTTAEKEILSGSVEKGGFLKNQKAERQKQEFKSKSVSAVKDTLINEVIIPRGRNITGEAQEHLADTPGNQGVSGRSNSPAEPASNSGKSFSSLAGLKEKSGGDSPADSSFNRGKLKRAPESAAQEISLPSSSAGTDVGITITGEIQNRKIIKSYMPLYPAWLMGEGVEPVVVLRFTVLPDGHVKNKVFVKLTSGFTKLDKLAINELKQWVFAPLSGEKALREETGEIAFKFSLQ